MSDQRSRERVWAVVAAIPPGEVRGYGEVAALAGRPRGARWVASALRDAPPELDIPWHRVVNARGEISIPDPALAAEQRRRLEAEGVRFEAGRAMCGRTLSLDAVLWSEPGQEEGEP